MIRDNYSDKVFCKYCVAENNINAQFCKNCGQNFKIETNLITRVNDRINLFSVLIGLIVTVIILLIASTYFGVMIMNGMDTMLYLFLVLFLMLFVGGFVTGITGTHNIKEGIINGSILSLMTFIILGFLIGIFLLITTGIAASIASAFSSVSTSTSQVSNTSTALSQESLFFIIKVLLMIITSFFAGIGGGALGAWIREIL